MNLAAFADLAIRLVNSAAGGSDPLRTREGYRELMADHPSLCAEVTHHDLERLRLLREELRAVFGSAASGDDGDVATRLNALLITHPLHPVLVRHGPDGWHLHLAESGSACDRYAAAAVGGLAAIVGQGGPRRLGVCSIAACDRVFIDSSSNGSRRYCSEHSVTRSTVAALGRLTAPGTQGTAETAAPAAS